LARQQRGSVAAPTDALIGPRWGATEGGLDKLGWVRGLVQFSDFRQQQLQQQQQQQQQQSSQKRGGGGSSSGSDPAAPAVDTIGWLEGGAGLRPQTASSSGTDGGSSAGGAASSAPSFRAGLRGREEVALLQTWLQDMMAQVTAQAAGGGQHKQLLGSAADAAALAVAQAAEGSSASSALAAPAAPATAASEQAAAAELADAALWVYGMAFEELQRQVATECGDRGALLGGMWQHVFSLVELRCACRRCCHHRRRCSCPCTYSCSCSCCVPSPCCLELACTKDQAGRA
jgi:hypothetical protein